MLANGVTPPFRRLLTNIFKLFRNKLSHLHLNFAPRQAASVRQIIFCATKKSSQNVKYWPPRKTKFIEGTEAIFPCHSRQTHQSSWEWFQWEREMKKSGIMLTFICNHRYKSSPFLLCNKRQSMNGIEMARCWGFGKFIFMFPLGAGKMSKSMWNPMLANVIPKVPLIGFIFLPPANDILRLR